MIFSQILSTCFNTPYFQDRALKNLDEFIAKEELSVTAEDVLFIIANDYFFNFNAANKDDFKEIISTAKNTIPNRYTRLKLASSNEKYTSYIIGTMNYKRNDNLFPLEIIHFCRYHSSDNFDYNDGLTIKSITNRLKNELGVSHSTGKTLLARSCGFKNGNALQRFSDLLSLYLKTWSYAGIWFNYPASFFGLALSQSYALLNKSSYSQSHFNDQTASDIVKTKHDDVNLPTASQITDSENFIRMREEGLNFYSIENDDLETQEINFYQNLYDFTVSRSTNNSAKPSLMKDIIRNSVFIELIHLSIVKPVAYAELHLNVGPTVVVSAEEARYNFYHAAVGGHRRNLQHNELCKMLDNVLNVLSITFNPEQSETAYFGVSKRRTGNINSLFNL